MSEMSIPAREDKVPEVMYLCIQCDTLATVSIVSYFPVRLKVVACKCVTESEHKDE